MVANMHAFLIVYSSQLETLDSKFDFDVKWKPLFLLERVVYIHVFFFLIRNQWKGIVLKAS